MAERVIYGPSGRPLSVSRAGATNNNWRHWTHGLIDQQVLNPDNISLRTYERMLKTDETVKFAVGLIKLAVVSRLGEYTHDDKKIADLVNANLKRMRGNLKRAVRGILSALPYGFSVTETVFNPGEDADAILDSLPTLHPRSVTFELDASGPNKNGVSRVWQWRWQGEWEVEIPLQQCILYTHGEDSDFGNPYGTSALKAAYKSWYIKDRLLQAWATTLERYGTPLAHVKLADPNETVQMADGTDEVASAAMLRALQQLANGNSALVTDMTTEIEFVEAKRAFGGDFEAAINNQDKKIFRAIFVPSLVADNGDVGSYSLGQEHVDVLFLFLDELLEDVVEALIEQLARPIIELQFGPQDDYGTWNCQTFRPEDMKLLSEVALNLVNAGVLMPGRMDDLNAWRTRFDLDALKEGDLPSQTEDGSPSPPDRSSAADQETLPDDQPEDDPGTSAPKGGRNRASRTGLRERLLHGLTV